MGSITGSVGSDGGIQIPPVGAPITGQPGFKGSSSWIATSIYDPTYPNGWGNAGGYVYVPFEYGWRAFTFQLIPGTGSSTANITISGTNDYATAANQGGTAWEKLPSGTAFPNPLVLNGLTPRIFYVESGPWTAFQFLANSAFPGASGAYILFGAAS